MSIIGHRIGAFAMAGMLCVGLSRSGAAQMADTADALSIETVNVTVYRVKEPAKAPIAKSETKGRAPSTDAIWVPGFWNLQGDRNTGPRAGWVWVPGRWLTPPVRDARWDPAHWDGLTGGGRGFRDTGSSGDGMGIRHLCSRMRCNGLRSTRKTRDKDT